MAKGFSLEQMTAAYKGKPGGVSIVYETHISDFIPGQVDGEFTGNMQHAPTFVVGQTVQQVLEQNGYLATLKSIEKELAAKSRGVPEGYTLRVLNVVGQETLKSTDLGRAGTHVLADGDVIVISGKMRGAF